MMASTSTLNCGPYCSCAKAAEAAINKTGTAPSVPLNRKHAKGRKVDVSELLSSIHTESTESLPQLFQKPSDQDEALAGQISQLGVHTGARHIDKAFSDTKSYTDIQSSHAGEQGTASAQEVLPPSKFPYPTHNAAYNALKLPNDLIHEGLELSKIATMPKKTVRFGPLAESVSGRTYDSNQHPPPFIQPHPPNDVFAAPIVGVRELTKEGAFKRIYHVDLDVSKYPLGDDEEWKLGGSFGVCVPNSYFWVNKLFSLLGIADTEADEPINLQTTGGRWPTIWGDEQARELQTTRREIVTWATDFMSAPVSKKVLRLLAEYASSDVDRTILVFLCSKQGQEPFCALRASGHINLLHLLSAFPSSKPPLDLLLSALPQLMPRWYSLSNDPQKNKGILEFAFTVAHIPDWERGRRHGVATTYLEDICKTFLKCEREGKPVNVTLPMFRGLQKNPFALDLHADGPMVLIGAGVGIAPFRGFIQRRLSNASCIGKVWVIQGCRDQSIDGIYSEDWDAAQSHEDSKVRYVTESRSGRHEYVQNEVRRQSRLIWNVITHEHGRIYLCGAGSGFCQGVEEALIDVAKVEGGVDETEAKRLWKEWNSPLVYKYIKEVW